MFKNILLAVDLSAGSRTVAKQARTLADMFDAQLSAAYVLEYTPVVYGGGEFAIPIDNELMATFEKNSRTALAELAKDVGIPQERQHVIAMDSIKHAVINLAERLKIDLIVIGSHGTHGPALLLGSTANAILHAAKCDILAVRI